MLFLQLASKAVAQPLPHPDLQADVNLWAIVAWAALNPAMIATAYLMGRRADQPAKLGIVAFAAAIAGVGCLWLAARLQLGVATDVARGAVGVFMTSLPFGMAWAWLGQSQFGRSRG
jgi:hypothetical protein